MGLPGWLLKDEGYSPRPDADRFIDRSILSFLGLLSRGRYRDDASGQAMGLAPGPARLSPSAKLVFMLGLLLLVSLSRSSAFLALVATLLLVLLASQKPERIAAALKVASAVSLFTFLVLLPSILMRSGSRSPAIVAKVFISVATVRLAVTTNEWAQLTRALRRLGMSDLFILVLDIAMRYVHLLAEFALAMLYALRLRSVGRNGGKGSSLAGIAGTIFLKSKEMAEDMYAAMECRGFMGEYRGAKVRAHRSAARAWPDLAAFLALGLLGLAFLLLKGSP